MHSGLYNSQNSPFSSFWMGGFECADHLNVHGNRVNFLDLTGHLKNLQEDYRLLQRFNIKTVREGICWSLLETAPYAYNFTQVSALMDAGACYGIQQVWDICHFGYPADLTPLHPHFKDRFVALCEAFVHFHLSRSDNRYPLIVTPINEVSFISWLGGEVAATSPYCRGKGWDVKYELMKAYIAGVKVMKAIYPEVLILSTEPLVNIVPPLFATEEQMEQAISDNELQYQANDMLCGRICPELGGKEEYLDIVGLNYYYTNQYTCCNYEIIPWLNDWNDPRWRPPTELISEAHYRYNRPVLLAETSHPGEDRSKWISFISSQCYELIESDIPLLGICIYPIVDRPDWDDTSYWHDSGLWGAIANDNSARPIDELYASTILKCQARLINRQASLALSNDDESVFREENKKNFPFANLVKRIADWKIF